MQLLTTLIVVGQLFAAEGIPAPSIPESPDAAAAAASKDSPPAVGAPRTPDRGQAPTVEPEGHSTSGEHVGKPTNPPK
jgi:hypothetical protein